MNIIRKASALAITLIFALGGCSLQADYSGVEGRAQVEAARTAYEQLDSAHFIMRDNLSGMTIQEMSFRYRADDVLVYDYHGTDGETDYYERHNGNEILHRSADSEEWTVVTPLEDSYYVYSRSDRHPLTTANIMAVTADAIIAADVREHENGALTVHWIYDPAKMAGMFEDELLSYEATYSLDPLGRCTELNQKASFGSEQPYDYDYSLIIDGMNETEVE